MDKELWKKAENDVKQFSKEEFNKLAKQTKNATLFGQIALLFCCFLGLAVSVIGFVFNIMVLGIIFLVLTIAGTISIIIWMKKCKEKSVDYWATCGKYTLLMREKVQSQANGQRTFIKYDKKIKEVYILDSNTEVTNKLHAVLNWQEVIQTRYYTFKVVYEDLTTQIIKVAENSQDYAILIQYVKASNEVTKTEKSGAEQIKEYKQLLDDGIITEEEFNKKKQDILNNK